MPWFWGSSNNKDHDEEGSSSYDSDEYEYVTDSEAEDEEEHHVKEHSQHGEEEEQGDEDHHDEDEQGAATDKAAAENLGDKEAKDASEVSAEHAVAAQKDPSGHHHEEEEPDEHDDIDSVVEEQVLAGHLPDAVHHPNNEPLRTRLDSGLTFGDDDEDDDILAELDAASSSHHVSEREGDDDDAAVVVAAASKDQGGEAGGMSSAPTPRRGSSSNSNHSSSSNNGQQQQHANNHMEDKQHADQEEEDDDEEDDEQVTSIHEKQSLLVLAAEHDRVDILQAILAPNNNNNNSPTDTEQQQQLLNGSVPPLHIAVSYGSIHATNCLLRMGANPAVRPNVPQILQAQHADAQPIASIHRYDGASAWELVFGNDNDTKKTAAVVNVPLSKREGIRHAFTAEALRCIGSDEVDRLQQLLQSGMPASIDIGGKHLYDWSVEMGALSCEELLRPTQVVGADANAENNNTTARPKPTKRGSAVLDRPGQGNDGELTLSQLTNRLVELDSLSTALSTCLDNLGEEVAVCSGLLLSGSGGGVGGGASGALASHVRSLKQQKHDRQEQLERLDEAWEHAADELAYWVRQAGPEGERIAAQMTPPAASATTKDDTTNGAADRNGHENDHKDKKSDDTSTHERQQLQAQIAASDSRIRMLRVSIADLSDENTRNLKEVERRGLSGGITLVRGLRDEIRDLDFSISQAVAGDAECRLKISMIQTLLRQQGKHHPHKDDPEGTTPSEAAAAAAATASKLTAGEMKKPTTALAGNGSTNGNDEHDSEEEEETPPMKDSERIATGQSTALVPRGHDGDRGFFPLTLWEILMRIIGRREFRRSSSRGQPAVII